MARFLYVVPPLAGHVNPSVAIGRTLKQAGHEVAWVGCGQRLRPLLADDLTLIPIAGLDQVNESWMAKAQRVMGLESFQFFYQEFLVPLADAMMPGVLQAIDEFQPDLILCDQQALAGALAARRCGIPWVTVATTSAAVFHPIAQLPKVKEWMIEILGQVQDRYQLQRWERPDLSDRLVLILSVRDLIAPEEEIPDHYQFVGPTIREDGTDTDFPWQNLRKDQQKIYLSLGTINAERSVKFYSKVKEAFAGQDLQVIVSAPPAMLGDIPSNFIVQKFVPQIQVLKEVDAVIFHGGHNTFCETLLYGLPALVAPIKDDQPVIAEQLVRSGAGLRIHFDRVKSADLASLARRVLDEPQFKVAAQRMQKILQKSSGSQGVLQHLNALVMERRMMG